MLTIRAVVGAHDPAALARILPVLTDDPTVEVLCECVSGWGTVRAIEQHRPHLVVLDVDLPDLSGFEVLEEIAGRADPDIIFIAAKRRDASEAFEWQALDYLVKPIDPRRLERALNRARLIFSYRREHEVVERLNTVFSEPGSSPRGERLGVPECPQAMAISDMAFRIVDVNRSFCELFGYDRDALVDRLYFDLHEDPGAAVMAAKLDARIFEGREESFSVVRRLIRADGSAFDASVTVSAVRDQAGDVRYVSAMLEPVGLEAGPSAAVGDSERPPRTPSNERRHSADDKIRLLTRKAGRVVVVDVEDVEWIEAAGSYARLHLGGDGEGSHLIRSSMNRLEAQLDPREFCRIHRSYLVRIARIRELRRRGSGDYCVVLADGAELPLSRGRHKQVRRRLA